MVIPISSKVWIIIDMIMHAALNNLYKKKKLDKNLRQQYNNKLNRPICTGLPRSYRKYIQQITQPSLYRYEKLQYRFAVTSWSPRR